MNAFVDENQKLRDELAATKGELVATRDELAAAITRLDTAETGLRELETMAPKLGEMKNDYEQLSSLLGSEHLFSSERFRSTIQAESQIWKELPSTVQQHMEKEVGKVVDEVVLVRSEVVALQQKLAASESARGENPAVVELRQALERVEKKQEELEGKVGMAEEVERTKRASASSVPRLSPNDTVNMHSPSLPPRPPVPWMDQAQQGPQRRGSR